MSLTNPIEAPAFVPEHISARFEQATLALIDKGQKNYSSRAILHHMRWHETHPFNEDGFGSFKIRNEWSAPLARWFMARHPQYDGFFRTREAVVSTKTTQVAAEAERDNIWGLIPEYGTVDA